MRHTETDTIGRRLAHVRAGRSQADWAQELGVPLRTYQNYEQDKREPDVRTLMAMAERGWNLNWIVSGEEPRRIDALPNQGHARDSQIIALGLPGAADAERRRDQGIKDFSAGVRAAQESADNSSQSAVSGVDVATVTLVLSVIEEGLGWDQWQALTRTDQAELVHDLYALLREEGQQIPAAKILRLIRSSAAR